MNRQLRRKYDRETKDLQKKIEKMDGKTVKIVDKLSEEKAAEKLEKYIELFSNVIEEALIKSMRENRVSMERAERIIKRTNEIMVNEMREERNELSKCS